mgnify:CR=1 FL=1
MNVLIIGGGGREHALAWQASKNRGVHKIFVAPGNAGTALEKKTKNVWNLKLQSDTQLAGDAIRRNQSFSQSPFDGSQQSD